MHTPVPARKYHPELISRRGEGIAWASALLVGGAWLVLARSGQGMNWLVPILAILLLLAALGISLGNWMDRNTWLQLDDEGIQYQNGLRHVRLKWDEIQQVQVTPAQWGRRVEVIGRQAHFRFHTLGEVKVGGELKGRTGFAEGEWILKRILEHSGLEAPSPTGTGGKQAVYYYTRD